MAFVYKIRRKSDGLYSAGGGWPRFTKKGKIWTSRGALSNHLALVRDSSYKDAELVTLELVEQVVDVESIEEVNAQRLQRKAQRDADRQAMRDAYRLERERAEYERLKKQFGG